MEFLKSKTREITAGEYVPSIAEIVNSVQQIGTGAVLIVNNYILDLIQGNVLTTYIFYSGSKDEDINLSTFGTAVMLKFDMLQLLDNYIRSVYYNK